MRLPRRVPWASIAELDQVCSWIFSDENDIDSKFIAVNKLSAWRSTTSLPHALDSTLAILTVILQDTSHNASSSYLSLRQSYAAAIIRLVNGLVDPLQLGAYARPIASIAAQLGLPGWLVELRHAATHEDLPSLELLREAARQSMSWLLRNYFLPTLNPSSAVHSHLAPLRPLLPILKQYKSIFKITIRDVSLRTQYNTATNYILREIERWVTEAKVAANIAVGGFGWDVDISAENGDQDVKERWALDRLCEALLEKGALIPTSKKKRIFPVDTFLPPRFSVLLWTPLLSHLQSHHPDLPSVLADHIINLLLSNGGPQAELKRDDFSFDMCLARWVFWIIDEWSDGFDLKKDVMTTFVTALGPGMKQLVGDRKVASALLQALCAGNEDLDAVVTLIPAHAANNISPAREWSSKDIDVMNERLDSLLSLTRERHTNEVQIESQMLTPPEALSDGDPAPGWRLVDGWKPCPVGVYYGNSSL